MSVIKSFATESEWLAYRQTGVGASEALAALGLSKYKSAYTLWAEKSGKLAPIDETIPMRAGRILEPLVADLYHEETGRPVVDPGPFVVYEHDDFPWLRCTPDRFTGRNRDTTDGAPLELKTTGHFNAAAWRSGEPPLDNVVQLLIQQFILGAEWGALAGLIANREFAHVEQERDDRVLNDILPKLREFWNRVQEGDAPPVDGSDSTAKTIKLLHPKDNGETVILPPEATEIDETLAALKAERKIIDDQIAKWENWMRAEIGDATFGTFGTVQYSFKTQTRKGALTVPYGCIEQLLDAQIPFDIRSETEFRVLRRGTLKEVANV